MVSTIGSDQPGELTVGIGLAKRPTGQAPGTFTADRARGTFALWGPTDPDQGTMGTALLVDPATIVEVREDADNHLVLLRVTPGEPFVYYAGAAWDKGGEIHSQGEWEAYVAGQRADFDAGGQ